jgi:hypothetical protein
MRLSSPGPVSVAPLDFDTNYFPAESFFAYVDYPGGFDPNTPANFTENGSAGFPWYYMIRAGY